MRYRAAVLACMALAASARAADAVPAPVPPMGWNPWNAFRTEVTEAKILAVAEKLKSSGLADAGYRYVNVDDGWWLKRRADGRLVVRTAMFPSAATPDGAGSLKPFADRLHALGLKAGLYTDIGRNVCSQAWDPRSPNLPTGAQAEREVGSMDHQRRDMALIFGEWGFDYIKVDACGLADYGPDSKAVRGGAYRAQAPSIVRHQPERGDAAQVERLYATLGQAIAAVRPARDHVLSICTWGEAGANDWGGRHGQMWRTSPDIHPTWQSMLASFDSAAGRALYAGPGRWNDPDMLQIGNGAFGAGHLVEARAHLSLWAILAAPLLLGTDLTRTPDSLIAIAGNRAVIAIDQDPAGNQGVTVSRAGDGQVVVKSLAARGHKAIALINRGDGPLTLTVPLRKLHLRPGVTVRDVWTDAAYELAGDTLTRRLAPRETALLRVTGAPLLARGAYLSEMPASIRVIDDGRQGKGIDPGWVPAQVNAAPSGQPLVLGATRFDEGLGVLGDSRLRIDLRQRFATFRATVGPLDGTGTAVAFQVIGDGRVLAERRSAGAETMAVDVAGIHTLDLVVGAGATTAAWADARLE